MLTSKILVPLDGSELAESITVHAQRLLHAKGASVALLRVVDSVDELASASRELEVVRARFAERGVPATARVVVGDPARRIVEIAEETGATLIALSTHARSGVARLARGSVAEEVLRSALVPVLVASPLSLGAREELPIRRILVPLDGSQRAAAVLPEASELARLHGAELVLLHAVDLSWCHYPEVARPHMLAEAKAYLARELERLDVRARGVIEEGDPATRILEAVAKEGADIIALAAHGRTGLARLAYGSVAEAVVRRSTCPLLVARRAGKTESPDPRVATVSRGAAT
jgi:nucleotide-binding universal stress UspA family protein